LVFWGWALLVGLAAIVVDFFVWASGCWEQTDCTGMGEVAFYLLPLLLVGWLVLAVAAFVRRWRSP
jgi:uncharacterized membrane protein YhaH (DUF805 family)